MVCNHWCNMQLKWIAFTLTTVFLSACAVAPDKQQGPVFYLTLPDSPRIQHLHSITVVKDIGVGNTLANFVLGPAANEPIAQKPYGLATRPGKIYAVDTRGSGYVVVDLEKSKHTLIIGSGFGQMSKPINIAIDKQDNKYITDAARNQVLLFDSQDEFVRAYGVKGQFKLGDVVMDGDRHQ